MFGSFTEQWPHTNKSKRNPTRIHVRWQHAVCYATVEAILHARPWHPRHSQDAKTLNESDKGGTKLTEPDNVPPIVMYHAYDDRNCPINDTVEFFRSVKNRRPNQKIVIEEVRFIVETDGRLVASEDVGHGFDHDSTGIKTFIARYIARIDYHWFQRGNDISHETSIEDIEKIMRLKDTVQNAEENARSRLLESGLKDSLNYVTGKIYT